MSSSSPLSKATAARELLVRKQARTDILRYVGAIDIPGKPVVAAEEETEEELVYEDGVPLWKAPKVSKRKVDEDFAPVENLIATHHRLIMRTLFEVAHTPHGRVMFFMPPGSAKSTYASVVFPSHYLGEAPGRKIILASYGDDLARKMGRRTRSIIRQPRYRHIFGAELSADSQAAQEFSIMHASNPGSPSEYLACGILSGVTGNRAHGIIIDDPMKGREQAESEVVREKTWNAYEDDLKTRLLPRGWICIIQTRWHRDDLSGRILPDNWAGESGQIKCKDGNVWTVVCLQARCEVENDPIGRQRGEYLWPEWFDRQHWAQYESNDRTWSALYQQLPRPPGGNMFKVEQFKYVFAEPANIVRRVRGWDFGSTTKGDWTVGLKLGELDDGRFIVLDVVRFQLGPDERDAAFVNAAHGDGRRTIVDFPQDPGQAGKSQVLYMTKKLAGHRVYSSPETGDKAVRAEPVAAQVNVGNVLLLHGPWCKEFVDELKSFPGSGKWDDQVDALSRAFNRLVEKAAGIRISQEALAATATR